MTLYTWLASVDEILEILELFRFFERTIRDEVDYETMWIGLHISLVTEWKQQDLINEGILTSSDNSELMFYISSGPIFFLQDQLVL